MRQWRREWRRMPAENDALLAPSNEGHELSRVYRTMRASRKVHLVAARCSARKQGSLLRGRGLGRQPLESIPQHAVAGGDLVDREVALEHAAIGAEQLDAGLDPGLEGVGQHLRAGRRRPLVKIEPAPHPA